MSNIQAKYVVVVAGGKGKRMQSEMPKQWYNVRADMKKKPAPLLNPGTLEPMTKQELGAVFCDDLIDKELNNTDA